MSNQQETKPLYAYSGKLTFGIVTVSKAGKEFFTGYIAIPDPNGGQSQSYKCTSFRSSVINQAKHVGAVGENKEALKNIDVVLMSTGFAMNDYSKKYEMIFESMEFQAQGWKEISVWFNDPANNPGQ